MPAVRNAAVILPATSLLRFLVRASFGLFLSFAALASEYGAYSFWFPYDGTNGPSDPSRIAFGSSVAETCAVRSDAEMIGNSLPPGNPILFVGVLDPITCGYQWLNGSNPGIVVDRPQVRPAWDTCSNYMNAPPAYARPAMCYLDCPDSMKDSTGFCRNSSGPNLGQPDLCCGNPINPGTGNKFQAETDYRGTGQGQLAFIRLCREPRDARSADLEIT